MCTACQINGMKKTKKNKGISGMVGASLEAPLVTVGAALPAMVLTQELKTVLMPMLVATTDTPDKKATTGMIVNAVGLAVGMGVAVASSYMEKDSIGRSAVLGIGAGIATQCALVLYTNNIRPKFTTGGTIQAIQGIGAGWQQNVVKLNADQWNAARLSGVDNISPGVMGVDNISPGVMGPIPAPARTRYEEIGKTIGRYNMVGNGGL